MNVTCRIRTTLLLLSSSALACGGAPEPAEQRFETTLRVVSDEGHSLAGARFSLGQQVLGTTGSAGTLTVRVRGSEGQALRLALDCPEGYSPPPALPPLRLTRTRQLDGRGSQALSFEAACTRRTRNVALVVHATNGVALPVLVNGAEQAKTDADGNAHVLLVFDRDQRSVTVELDTTARPELRPAKPERVFELAGHDAVLLFEPSFTSTPAKRAARPARAAGPPARHVPYRID